MLSKMFLEKVFKKNDSSKIHVFKKNFYRVKENGFQIVVKKKKKVFFAFLKRAKFLQYFFSQNKCVLPCRSSKKKKKDKKCFFSSKYANRIFSKNVHFQNNKVNFVTFFYFKPFSLNSCKDLCSRLIPLSLQTPFKLTFFLPFLGIN